MKVNVELITPEIAKKLLEKNHSNRKLRKMVVDTYAEDIKDGRWELTHQGIAFDKNGDLVDGQHRLSAIVQAGIAVPMVVAEGVDSRVNIDNHAKRNLTDTTGHSTMKIAMARCVLDRLRSKNRIHASSSEIKEYIDEHLDNFDFAEKSITRNQYGVRSAAVRAAIYVASFYEDESRLSEFADVISTGRYTDSNADSAALRVRDWLISSGTNLRSNQKLIYMKTEMAIRAFCNRKYVGKITVQPELIYKLPIDDGSEPVDEGKE